MHALQRLQELGLVLPPVAAPAANYLPVKRDGDHLYISGQGARGPDGSYYVGKVGDDVSLEEAYWHAQLAGLSILAAAESLAGGLDRLEVVKLFGMVNAAPTFTHHPQVINGCSDLLVNVLGERGRHARSAIGMGSLPNGMTVEIEAVFKIHID